MNEWKICATLTTNRECCDFNSGQLFRSETVCQGQETEIEVTMDMFDQEKCSEYTWNKGKN